MIVKLGPLKCGPAKRGVGGWGLSKEGRCEVSVVCEEVEGGGRGGEELGVKW